MSMNIRLALEELLTAQSRRPQATLCLRCHAVLQQPELTFFLLNDERSWTIPFAVCPNCDLDS